MVPFWRLRFWTEHFLDLLPPSKIAVPLALGWSFAERMWLGTVHALEFSPVLLGLSMTAVVVDTATGCYDAITRPSAEVFSSATFGRVIDKGIKYVAVILVFSAIAAAGERSELPTVAFSWLRDFGYLVVIVREGSSAVENVWGKPLGKLIVQFRSTLQEVSE